jgi:arginase
MLGSEPMDVALIGVPFDSAGTPTGVARAPAALRAAGLPAALQEAGVAVVDMGDVRLAPSGTMRDPASGIIAPDALLAMIGGVRDAVRAGLAAGALPLVIGGDCPVLLGCLGAIGEGIGGLLFVDGHEDAWPPRQSTTGEAADMELGLLLGRSLDDLPDPLRSALPGVRPERVAVVGARDQRELAEAGVASIDTVVDVIRTEGMTTAAIEALVAERIDRLDAQGDWWLHVDLDVLSTASLSAVDYRQDGGLDWATLTSLTQQALAGRAVTGWTVTIYNPDLDADGREAAAIVGYIAEAARVLGSVGG